MTEEPELGVDIDEDHPSLYRSTERWGAMRRSDYEEAKHRHELNTQGLAQLRAQRDHLNDLIREKVVEAELAERAWRIYEKHGETEPLGS